MRSVESQDLESVRLMSPRRYSNNLAPSPLSKNSMSNVATRRRRIVDWIQTQYIPKAFTRQKTQVVPWVTGLDRVVFGSTSAAEAVTIAGIQPPRYLWYMISGFLCDILQFTFDFFLYHAFKVNDASLCWALSFFISIVFRHTSHRYLVFGDYIGGYWASLIRMYAGYSIIIVLSTIFNALVTKVWHISHGIAWVSTLLWTGIANYFILKKIWSFGGSSSGTPVSQNRV